MLNSETRAAEGAIEAVDGRSTRNRCGLDQPVSAVEVGRCGLISDYRGLETRGRRRVVEEVPPGIRLGRNRGVR
jgi:hypothetical protein